MQTIRNALIRKELYGNVYRIRDIPCIQIWVKTGWDDMAHEKKARENEPEEEQFRRQ